MREFLKRIMSSENHYIHFLGSPKGLQQSPKTSNVRYACPLWLSGSLRVSDRYAPWRNGGPSEPSSCPLLITDGLKPDSVLAPTLFSRPWPKRFPLVAMSLTSYIDSKADSSTLNDFVLEQRIPQTTCEKLIQYDDDSATADQTAINPQRSVNLYNELDLMSVSFRRTLIRILP